MSVSYRLPDGASMEFEQPVSALEIAGRISKKLAKQALAAKVNGNLIDVYLPIDDGATVEIITRDTDDALELIRHDAAHVMAEAVQELFPDTQVTIGPTIENGFYYDFHRAEPFTPDDLKTIEKRMQDIVRRNEDIRREVWDRDEAIAFFLNAGEEFKAEIIRDLPADQEVSLYRQGDFIDLCRGPHLPSTSKLGDGFKLTKVAGAYWRGDATKAQLQRIYGTAWRDKKELNAYLKQLEEAAKRDHRKLGKEMDLFHQQEEAPGMVFWHPRGWAIWQKVEQYVRKVYRDSGYQEVRGPQIMDVSLWKRSGHWDNYQENMFFTESEKRTYAVKPMNCPGHVQIYNAALHSYRDLPIRYAEFGGCHRNEPSGALHGIMRVRAFTQDDGHIFCTEDQVEAEVTAFHKQAMAVYADFGFENISVKLALRPDKRIGTDEAWDKAENGLRAALSNAGVQWEELPGEGAFYGPKIEYHLKDSIGRAWQMGTVQFDPMMPERLDAEYVDENSQRQRPIMLHRAIVGSMERFIGILIEHHAGHLPLWLAPVPVVIATITNAADDYARTVKAKLEAAGVTVEMDLRNEKIGYKVREHSRAKVPVILVLGKQEEEEQQVAIRRLGSQATETVALDEAVANLADATRLPI
ncbi:Threonyl-tRNA synthetase [Alcanivorax hongdengensis A-11-3]|uniref:Threonine--tRNA ligase n=1 Tax=Alcanivorax hongdengensis A-11-3 TaxID=1177179 RepID=L0WGL5_9GAMM|nr:threonine--tRNA ligase [Alcanivorax hongdengensis]EKF75859.1 Threonyl-tRNA synthetase [Alcanivorax hongdengensis A-11-3]